MEKIEPVWRGRQLEIEKDSKLTLDVPINLVSPHRLISQAKQILSSKEGKSYKYSGMQDATREDGIDIRVTPALVPRALRFMDTLIKLFEARGYSLKIDSRGTYVVLKGQDIKIACREKTKIVEKPGTPWPTREYVPTGVLSFKSEGYHSGEWKDGTKKLEEQLSKILAFLEESVQGLFAIWEENRKRDEIREAAERKEKEAKLRIANEIRDFKQLLQKSLRWQQASVLRKYLIEVEQKFSSEDVSTEHREWLAWAQKKADWFDPLVESTDPLLDGIDRDSLIVK